MMNLSKILRPLTPKYVIRAPIIQQFISISLNIVTLDLMIGKLIAFELSNFDNNMFKEEFGQKISELILIRESFLLEQNVANRVF